MKNNMLSFEGITTTISIFIYRCYAMIKLKIDLMEELKKRGFTTYRLRKDKLLGTRIIQEISAGSVPGIVSLGTICTILDCQPGDIIENVATSEELEKIKTGKDHI